MNGGSMKVRDSVVPARPRPVVVCGPSLTKQAPSDAADINKMVARYRQTGSFENVNGSVPQFLDVTSFQVSYQDAMNVVRKATESFAALSASVRERFNNDPARLVSFLQDPANGPESIRLGLRAKLPVKPIADPVVPAVKPA